MMQDNSTRSGNNRNPDYGTLRRTWLLGLGFFTLLFACAVVVIVLYVTFYLMPWLDSVMMFRHVN